MITTLLGVETVLLPVLYLLLWGTYLWSFLDERGEADRWGDRLLIVVLAAHTAMVVLQSFALHRFPLGSPLELASLMALSLTTIYVVVERVLHVRQTGVVIVGLAFVLQLLASAFAGGAVPDDPLLHDPGYTIHAVLVLLAYTALSLGFVYALLYMLLARQLAARRFGLLYRRLPPLETLERLSVASVRLGTPLLFLALATGHLWMYSLMDSLPPEQAARLSPFDAKVLTSWVVLIVYVVGLVGHDRWGWRGRRMGRVAVTAWVVAVVAIGIVHHAAPSFHDFDPGGGSR